MDRYTLGDASDDLGLTIPQIEYRQRRKILSKPITKESVAEYLAGDDIRKTFNTKRHDAKEVIMTTKHVTTVEEMVTLMEIDMQDWEVRNMSATAYGNPQYQQFRIKADFKRIEHFDENLIHEMYTGLKPVTDLPKAAKKKKSNIMMQINIFDLHYAKMAHIEETGGVYNSAVARERFMGAIKEFVAKAEHYNVDEVWFPIGNDFFNSDTAGHTTTAGTQMHDDKSWQKSYKEGLDLLIDAIEYIRQHVSNVKVFHVPGNHDRQKSYYAILHINAFYGNTDSVQVDTSPRKHKAYQYGKVGIYFTHGERIKLKELDRDFQANYPDIWNDTIFREIHIGHFHHEEVLEVKNAKIRMMSSLSGDDNFHYDHGYTGTLKQAQCFIWHAYEGLKDIYHYTVADKFVKSKTIKRWTPILVPM